MTSVEEGGVGNQSVTYTYTIKNTSSASTDPVTLTSVSDEQARQLAAPMQSGDGQRRQRVSAPGATVTFTET